MATELEIKFAVPGAETLDAIFACASVRERMHEPQPRQIQMETTYFDTVDGSLSARRWTYRLRQENGCSVVTLKTPGEGYARGEWECRAAHPQDAAQALIALGAPQELAEILHASPLKAVCGAQFTRRAVLLLLEDDTLCELCGDIGMLLGGAHRRMLCELELELKRGSETAMLDYARTLADAFSLHEERKSKFARARALAKGL